MKKAHLVSALLGVVTVGVLGCSTGSPPEVPTATPQPTAVPNPNLDIGEAVTFRRPVDAYPNQVTNGCALQGEIRVLIAGSGGVVVASAPRCSVQQGGLYQVELRDGSRWWVDGGELTLTSVNEDARPTESVSATVVPLSPNEKSTQAIPTATPVTSLTSSDGSIQGKVEFNFPTATPSPTPLPTATPLPSLRLEYVRAHVFQTVDGFVTTVIGAVTNDQTQLVQDATVTVDFHGSGNPIPIDTESRVFRRLNVGDTRFFRLSTLSANVDDFEVRVEWTLWPEITPFPRELGLISVELSQCVSNPTGAPECMFQVTVETLDQAGEAGAARNVDIGLFDNTGQLIDVVSADNPGSGVCNTNPQSRQRECYIGADLGEPRTTEIDLTTGQSVENMESFQGGPW